MINTRDKQFKGGKFCCGLQFQSMVAWFITLGLRWGQISWRRVWSGAKLLTSWQLGSREGEEPGTRYALQRHTPSDPTSPTRPTSYVSITSPTCHQIHSINGLIHRWSQNPHHPITSPKPYQLASKPWMQGTFFFFLEGGGFQIQTTHFLKSKLSKKQKKLQSDLWCLVSCNGLNTFTATNFQATNVMSMDAEELCRRSMLLQGTVNTRLQKP
jgi:hypothetical protein